MHRIARGHRVRLDANDVQGTIIVAISAQLHLRALHKELDHAVPAGHHRMPDGRRLEEKSISSLATRAVVDVLVFYCNCHPAFSFGRRAHR